MKRFCILLCYLITNMASADLSVTFTGIDAKLRTRLLSDLSIDGPHYQSQVLTLRKVEALSLRGQGEINQSLQSYGYYSPVIKVTTSETQTNQWKIDFHIEMGPPVEVSSIIFELEGQGLDDAALLKTLQPFLPEKGKQFDHHVYETQKTQLLTEAIEAGYLKAHLNEHRVDIDPSFNSANIVLKLDTGPLFQFGEIQFNETTLDESFLKRFATFKKGDNFSSTKMLQFQAALRGTKYFNTVQVLPDRDAIGTLIPLDVHLDKKKPNNWLIGAGYSTDIGGRGRLGWDRRYIGSQGNSMVVNANVAEKRQQYGARYYIPGHHPSTDRYQIAIQEIREEIDHRVSDTQSLIVSSSARLGDWQRILKLEYMVASYREISGYHSVRDYFILPTMNFIRRQSDDPLFPNSGWRFEATLRGAIDVVLSSETFAQLHTSFRTIQPIGQTPWHVLLKAEFGTTYPSINNLPLNLRFFTGGDRSVRGYRYRSLGPIERDAKGRSVVMGGKHLAVGSVELERRILNQFKGALFFDAGNTFDRVGEKLKTSYGAGLRWYSAVGPIRIDLAHPTQHHLDHQDLRVHLSIGPDL